MTSAQSLLNLDRPPVAVAFLNEPPRDVPRWSGGEVPAGCFFWKKAQEGHTFYTTPADHYNCAVGAYTHSISLPAERAGELENTVGFMVQSAYIALEEVASIPKLPATPPIIAYGPAETVSFAPSVIVVAAKPAQAMLLYEASLKAGAGAMLVNTAGRPGCAALPLALQTGTAALSLGCKGNRTFTGLPDTEMYVVIPGETWGAVSEHLVQANAANHTMGDYYQQRVAQFHAQ